MDSGLNGDAAGKRRLLAAGPGEWGLSAGAAYTPADRAFLLRLARQTIGRVVASGKFPEAGEIPDRLIEPRACFVTLTRSGELRGCIGHIEAREPLYRAVMDNARGAALRDTRFPPVQASELELLRISISVLTQPQPLAFDSPGALLAQLRPRTDGVILRVGGRGATFLPQVWEQLPDRIQFLERLALKAGGAPQDWRGPGVTVLTYQAESFGERGGGLEDGR